MEHTAFTVDDKKITLYTGAGRNLPLVVLNNFSSEGTSIVRALQSMDCTELNLVCITNLKWDHDMTPWYAPPLSASDTPCTGGADEYLNKLVNDILPAARQKLEGSAEFTAIAGYSLAGLFALYALYKTDIFDSAASMSGSLWFPDFTEFCRTHEMQRRPQRLYMSLGDRESRTRNPVLKTVQKNTEALVDYYTEQGLDVTFELNEGNHFKDAALRTAKGIKVLLTQK